MKIRLLQRTLYGPAGRIIEPRQNDVANLLIKRKLAEPVEEPTEPTDAKPPKRGKSK